MTIHQQSLDYTIDQLYSEVGGAAGLVMGTLVTIVRKIDNLLMLLVNWIKKELKQFRTRKVAIIRGTAVKLEKRKKQNVKEVKLISHHRKVVLLP